MPQDLLTPAPARPGGWIVGVCIAVAAAWIVVSEALIAWLAPTLGGRDLFYALSAASFATLSAVLSLYSMRLSAAASAQRRALAECQAGLRQMSLKLLHAVERERRELARELHDEIGQALTATKLRLFQVAGQHPDTLAITADLDLALAQVRSMSLNLRPSMIEDLGLVPTLHWYLDKQSRLGGVAADLESLQLVQRLDPDVENAAFRIVQEAITNVQRHADARRIIVRVRCADAHLHLEIHDDGAGFNPHPTPDSGGLLGMRERAALLGGSLAIESRQGFGTMVRVALPLRSSLSAGSAP